MTDWLQIDGDEFARSYGERPMAVGHGLVDHPLLTLDALAELADRMPADSVERNPANLPLVLPGGGNPRGGVDSAGDRIRALAGANDWIVLWNVEQDRAYKALLDEVLDEADRLLAGRDGGICRREGFVFLSSANSLTPVHFDPEHNFLLQVRGTKEMNVGRFATTAAAQRELERFYRGGHRNLEGVPGEPDVFRLEPGTGVYVPTHAPHWVRNGDDVSISFSVTFHTPVVLRHGRVHTLNAGLRRLGLSPRPPGRSVPADRAKSMIVRSMERVRSRRPNRDAAS